jgi:hypothetical protein
MDKRTLPLGVQIFSRIRKENLTQAGLEACFAPEIERRAAKNGLVRQDYFDKLKRLYNDCRFFGEYLTFYNPSALFKHEQ